MWMQDYASGEPYRDQRPSEKSSFGFLAFLVAVSVISIVAVLDHPRSTEIYADAFLGP